MQLCILLTYFVVSCRYWNTTISTWDSTGCNVVNYTSDSVVCECNHLTDFAAMFVEAANPLLTAGYDNSGVIVANHNFRFLGEANFWAFLTYF